MLQNPLEHESTDKTKTQGQLDETRRNSNRRSRKLSFGPLPNNNESDNEAEIKAPDEPNEIQEVSLEYTNEEEQSLPNEQETLENLSSKLLITKWAYYISRSKFERNDWGNKSISSANIIIFVQTLRSACTYES